MSNFVEMDCMNECGKCSHPESHFCSPECRDEWAKTMAFVLECSGCYGAGENYTSKEQAVADGWTDIEDDPEGWTWNQIGLCPECKARDEL